MERSNVARAVTWVVVENHLPPSGISKKQRGRDTAEMEPAASEIWANKQQYFLYTFDTPWLHREQCVFKTMVLDLYGLNLCSSKPNQAQCLFCGVASIVAAT